MDRRRRNYRPEVVGTLEDRLVLSTAAVNLAAFEHGPQLHPVVYATPEGADLAKEITRSGKPSGGQLTFSAQEVSINVPDAGGAAVGTFKVDYHNESTKPITSATIVEPLGHDLAYVPTGTHIPHGGQISVASGPHGSEILRLNLPDGIAPGAEGYLEFEAEALAPTRR